VVSDWEAPAGDDDTVSAYPGDWPFDEPLVDLVDDGVPYTPADPSDIPF
jgi:hypothetical protein